MTIRLDQAAAILPWMVEHRRHLHRHPEVGLPLPGTHEYLDGVLRSLGLTVERHRSAGLTVRIPGEAPDGVVSVLRADMDALPVEERTGLEFSSEVAGAMHACGHDLHMSMLLGAARVLTEHPPRRDTVLAFQPGEESDRGALRTLEHDNLALPGPATAFAIHVHALESRHSVSYSRGTFMAFGDWFSVTFLGPGGHASQPHLAGNPIDAGASFVTGLKALVAELAADEHVVATVTECLMGNTVNVIPARGRLRGTIRTLSATQRGRLVDGIRTLADQAAREVGITADFALHEGYPAVVSDAAYVSRLVDSLSASELAGRLREMRSPSMVIEDFAYFLQRWPGTMVYLGAHVDGHTAFNHCDDVVYDESVMATGAGLHLMAADGF